MPINVSQLDSLATLAFGVTPSAPVYEGDSFEKVIVVAEGFDSSGDAIDAAPFGSEDGGWGAEVEMRGGSALPLTVDTPLANDGVITLRLPLGASTGNTGKHRGKVRIFAPASRTLQRTLFDFIIHITPETP